MIGDLILPPGGILLIAAAGGLLWRWRPALGGSMVFAALTFLYVLSTPLCATLLLSPLQRTREPTLDAAMKAGAIVVLGAGQGHATDEKSGPSVDLLSLIRLRGAAELARRTGLPVLVSGGQIATSGPPLAVLMHKALALDFRVPVRWVEGRSLNTAGNARESIAMLRAAGIDTIILVTQAWHMPRAMQAFTALGAKVIPAPQAAYADHELSSPQALLPDARALTMSTYALHEWIGLAWYRANYGFPFPSFATVSP